MKLLRIFVLIFFLIPCFLFTLMLNLVSLFTEGLQLALIVFFPFLILLIALIRSIIHKIRDNDKIVDEFQPVMQGLSIRCRCCGGRNKVVGLKPGTCKYCFTKLRILDRIP